MLYRPKCLHDTRMKKNICFNLNVIFYHFKRKETAITVSRASVKCLVLSNLNPKIQFAEKEEKKEVLSKLSATVDFFFLLHLILKSD